MASAHVNPTPVMIGKEPGQVVLRLILVTFTFRLVEKCDEDEYQPSLVIAHQTSIQKKFGDN